MRYIALIATIYLVIFPYRGFRHVSRSIENMAVILAESYGMDTTRYVYIGAEACSGKCHNNDELGHQYDMWKESRHAESYRSLSTELAHKYCKEAGITENPVESSTCLRCHVTASGVDSASLGKTYKREDGVTCESCHKGEFIPKTFLPVETDCLKCHNDSVHNVAPFDFRERCLKISHPRPKK